ncbi:MAG: ABC transporter permease, partial [Sediminibacterium sp.]|nr:ABC transporter permease [Sediminibacterium sp.]
MSANYSQIRAMLAITKGSLKAILRSPSAVVFSIAFPLIFILVFGFIGGGNGKTSVKIAIDASSDTTSPVYAALTNLSTVKIVKGSADTLRQELEKGRITANVLIAKTGLVSPAYTIKITSSGAVM